MGGEASLGVTVQATREPVGCRPHTPDLQGLASRRENLRSRGLERSMPLPSIELPDSPAILLPTLGSRFEALVARPRNRCPKSA